MNTPLTNLYIAVNELMAVIGLHGQAYSSDPESDAVMNALYDIDGGVYDKELNLDQLKDQRDRLLAGMENIADLSCRETLKMQQCKHGQYGYEHCENCIADYAAQLIQEIEHD